MENNLKDQYYKNMSIKLQMETLTFEAESTPSFIFLIIQLSLRLCIQDTDPDLICQAAPDSHPSLH